RALFDEVGQSRIDGQAGAIEKFGHANTLWSARMRQWTRGGKGPCAMPRLDSIGNGRFSMEAVWVTLQRTTKEISPQTIRIHGRHTTEIDGSHRPQEAGDGAI